MSGEDIRENVIKGLECCSAMSGNECRQCPYSNECRDTDLPYGISHLAADALSLLKARGNTVCTKELCPMNASTISDDCNIKTCPWRTEGVEPKLSMNGLWYECPVCGRRLTRDEDNYCARCGKRVKWNG